MNLRNGNRQRAQHVGRLTRPAVGALDDPIPPLRRQRVRFAHQRNAVGRGGDVTGFLVEQAELVVRVFVQQRGVMRVMGLSVIKVTEFAPGGLLDHMSGLFQLRAVRT